MAKSSPLDTLRVRSVREWGEWLEKNHLTSPGIWLVFQKKEAGPVPFDYGMALDEALCMGWVDSLLRTIDEREYMRKFTPRKVTSTWSELNKRHVARLIREGRMKAPGMEKIEAAKANGMWEKKVVPPEIDDGLPGALLRAFDEHPVARKHYFGLSPSHQRQYNIWINQAKQADTVRRRVEEAIRNLERGEILGLK